MSRNAQFTRMPARKEPKETVVYPASKRPVPAFKPLRPSKATRIPTTESQSSVKSATSTNAKAAAAAAATAKKAQPKRAPFTLSSSEDEDDTSAGRARKKARTSIGGSEDDEDELPDNPLKSKSTTTGKKAGSGVRTRPATTTAKRKTSKTDATREGLPMDVSDQHQDDPSSPAQPEEGEIPFIPQPLLIRLLHEGFADKNTRIDTHAIQVLGKYVEVFVREAVARTRAEKKEAVEKGEASQTDVGWLELEDLEKVAASVLLDF